MAAADGSKSKSFAGKTVDEALPSLIDLLYSKRSWRCKGVVSMVMAAAKSALPWYLELVL
jgi:hypothetical protein